MSSLLEKLRPDAEEIEFDKIASAIFCDAVINELEAAGYDADMLKEAGVFPKGYGVVKDALKKVISSKASRLTPSIKISGAKAFALKRGRAARARILENIATGRPVGS